MEKLFANHGISLKLKELGFDEPCLGYYQGRADVFLIENSTLITNKDLIRKDVDVLAPLYDQVIDWFREKHNLNIYFYKEDTIWRYAIQDVKYIKKTIFGGYYRLNKAKEEAFLKAIELIKNRYENN